SMSLVLQQKGFASRVLGVELNPDHAAKALSLGLVHEILSLENAVQRSDLIILSTPINVAEEIVSGILDLVDKQVIMDVGST
ncbi:prephenate dehydrogenase/arogenate dehydrogenase family protein, partial [Acinetobacter baumannii]